MFNKTYVLPFAHTSVPRCLSHTYKNALARPAAHLAWDDVLGFGSSREDLVLQVAKSFEDLAKVGLDAVTCSAQHG